MYSTIFVRGCQDRGVSLLREARGGPSPSFIFLISSRKNRIRFSSLFFLKEFSPCFYMIQLFSHSGYWHFQLFILLLHEYRFILYSSSSCARSSLNSFRERCLRASERMGTTRAADTRNNEAEHRLIFS